MLKKIPTLFIFSSLLTGVSPAFATEEIAAQLNTPECGFCHSSPIQSKQDLRSGVASAFNQDQINLSGLKKFLAQQGPKSNNSKPVISPIALEWDIDAGQSLTIPLSVFDAEQDAFQLVGKLPGSRFSEVYIANTGLLTVDFMWTPTTAQANKVYTVKLTAKQVNSPKLSSAPVTAKIRVWPAGARDLAYVSKLVVATSKWSAGKLTLKGKVTLNKIMTAAEKSAFLSRANLTATISQGTTGSGAVIGKLLPLSLSANGSWSLTDMTLTAPFSCALTVEFEGKKAVRTIVGAPKDCIK